MTDLFLEAWVSGLIELAKIEWMFGIGRPWRPGEKLRLLFAGYNGSRNTGSDLRVEEMLRQVRAILGEENVRLTVMTQDFDLTRGYFGDARQVHLPDVFPPFLRREIRKHHGVIACEGSMFKSKFANALATMMIGSLGIAAAQNKLSIAYGAEAGYMDAPVQKMCRRYCRHSLVITRNAESQSALEELGIPTELGTDTAWTFEPLRPEFACSVLQQHGWDGSQPVLTLCPINPFWWPVRASIPKAVARKLFGAFRSSHYRTIYFHRSGREVRAAYERYIAAFSAAVKRFCERHSVFVIAVGMELLDSDACRRVSQALGGIPVFSSAEYNMYELVSILRASELLLSSRFHAIVTSMPAGVPSAGITMDERIRNLMRDRGHLQFLLEVDDPLLEERLFAVLEDLYRNREAVREGIRRAVVKNLSLMARMGRYLEEAVARQYPQFPLRRGALSWQDYLPPLSCHLRQLLESEACPAAR